MRVYQLTNEDGETTLYRDSLCLIDHAEGMPVGEKMTVEVVEMTEEAYLALPSD